jgi:hypothetical protein
LGAFADGGTATTLASKLTSPLAISLDTASVYWTNYDVGFGTVMKVALDGGAPATLAVAQDGPFGIAVGPKSVYWTDSTSGAVRAATPK